MKILNFEQFIRIGMDDLQTLPRKPVPKYLKLSTPQTSKQFNRHPFLSFNFYNLNKNSLRLNKRYFIWSSICIISEVLQYRCIVTESFKSNIKPSIVLDTMEALKTVQEEKTNERIAKSIMNN
jgi:hypothetical protein